MIKKAKLESWEEFGRFLEQNANENQKLFFKVIKNMRNKDNESCPLKFIKSKDGKILTDKKEIMQRWKDYFSELLIQHHLDDGDNGNESTDNQQSQGLEELNEKPPELKEVKQALSKVKLGKAAGSDGVTPEMLRFLGPVGEEMFHQVISLAWKTIKIPKDWEMAVIVPIFKKGDNRECCNHRGISLLSVPGKVYSRILEMRLRDKVEDKLEEAQCGFRPNRGTQDAIFVVRQSIEKTIEYGKQLHMCFIDIEKAFDGLPWKTIWKALHHYKVDKSLIQRIQSFYKTCRNQVRSNHCSSEQFNTNSGVRQGDIMSPLLFSIVMDMALKTCTGFKKYKLGNWCLQPVAINILTYADDLVLLAENAEKLQHNLNLLITALEGIGLKISLSKTKTMVVAREQVDHRILAKGQVIDQTHQFKYLGVSISDNGKMTSELNARIHTAGKLMHAIGPKFLRKREVSEATKLTVYRSIYTPILTYSSESWSMTNKIESRIQAAEMRYLRAIMGKTRRDRVRNTTIRNTLKVEPLSERITRAQLRWFGHVQRLGDQRYPKMALEARMEGRRPRGRRKKTWSDNIKAALTERNCTWGRAVQLAQDRAAWRSFCQPSTPIGR